MHLADRRGGDRRLVEFDEELLDAEAKLFPDDRLGLRERERCDVVLKCLQLEDDVGRNDIGPRGEELPELDERWTELVEHLAQPDATRRPFVYQRLDLLLAP